MNYHIIVRRLAERDLEEAEDWYNEQQSGHGVAFRGVISDLFRRLADNPGTYPRVHGDVQRVVLNVDGYARLDFRLLPNGDFPLLEANPDPEVSATEEFASAAEEAAIAHPQLLEKIVRLGLQRE